MAQIESYQKKVMECEQEIGRGLIGQKEIVRQVMLALLSGGNVLLEGMPGLGKTMLVRTVAQVFLLSFKRIQFTPDLMPSDVTGTNIMVKEASGLSVGPSLPTWFWRTRSTGPPPRPSPPFWKPCRSTLLPWAAAVTVWTSPFWCLPLRIPLNRRELTPCRRPSWIALCLKS